MAQRNVPVDMAARYLGMSTATLYEALQDERAPFGFAVHKEKQWTYQISPGLLVRYQNGELPFYKLNEVTKLMADGVEDILDKRMGAVSRVIEKVMRA